MEDERLTFKEMCTRFDVTARTLRWYEYVELLSPEKEGRSRFYGPKEVARLTLILRGRRFGFSLEEIRQWLLIYEQEGSAAQMEAWVQMADRQLESLGQEHETLSKTIEELKSLRNDVAKNLD